MHEMIYELVFFWVGVIVGAGLYRFSDYYIVAKILQNQAKDFPTFTKEEVLQAIAREEQDAAKQK